MKLEVGRYTLKIYLSEYNHGDNSDRHLDIAFIEDVLGLKNDGDSIRLVRKNAMGLSCIALLETKKDDTNDTKNDRT